MTNPRKADDVITLAFEVVPAPMEDIIRSSKLVRDVVMFGQGRKQVGVLIEPTHAIDISDEEAVAKFRNQIWPKIEEANSLSLIACSRIIKETILITENGKPMRRESGTVQPEGTLEDYAVEIDNLPSSWTPNDIEQWLLRHALAIKSGIDPHADLFLQGFNSLEAIRLRGKVLNALKHWLNLLQDVVPHNLIYQIPIIQNLSFWIVTLVNEGSEQAEALLKEQQKKAIDDMIRKYSFRPFPFERARRPIEPAVVLLTGSTGALGSSLLSELLQSHKVQRVFAFNRPSGQSSKERQKSAFGDRGLPTDVLDSERITYIEADASQDNCGLSGAQYEEIQDSVTLIIHSAWRVDFNLAISSFEDCIKASRNLVELGLRSRQRDELRFLFTSSIASASSWGDLKGPFPEEVQLDSSVAVGTGYGASKYVVERIITSSGLCATSLRIGQITGADNGCWGTSDWFPILVITSESWQKLPNVKGVVSWVAETYVVSAILDTAFAEQELPPALNLVSPESQRFDQVIEYVQKAIIKVKDLELHEREHPLPIIEPLEWWMLLREKADAPAVDLKKFPAVKLFPFISSVLTESKAGAEVAQVKCSIDKMKEVSRTVREHSCVVSKYTAEAWVRYWIRKGVL